jgi:hypothetical protein
MVFNDHILADAMVEFHLEAAELEAGMEKSDGVDVAAAT